MTKQIRRPRQMRKELIILSPEKVDKQILAKYGEGRNNQEIANQMGKTRAAVSLWRRGKSIPLDEAERFAELLGTTVGNLLSDQTIALLKSLLQSEDKVTVSLPREIIQEMITGTDKKNEGRVLTELKKAVMEELDSLGE